MRMLDESGPPHRQSPAVNAAVNVILALAYQQRATTHSPIPSLNPETCIVNAQSAINGLAPGQHDLLSLQVILGLVMLHLGTPHPGLLTASALIGSAIKLAHSLRLHHSRTNALFDDGTALQRVRVFWIAYILDRDLSFRRGDPPLQQEGDHDIADPVSAPVRFSFATGPGSRRGGGAAEVVAVVQPAHGVHLDVFRARVRLARIQGDIYEQLHSVRAEAAQQSADAQQRSEEAIHAMLRGWLAAIPAELHPGPDDDDNRLADLLPKPAARQLVALHFACLACFLQTHRVGSHDAEWISRLVHYSQRIVEPAAAAATTTEAEAEPALLSGSTLSPFLEPSSAWAEVVGAARECARLFRVVERDDTWLTWYFVSLLPSLTSHPYLTT